MAGDKHDIYVVHVRASSSSRRFYLKQRRESKELLLLPAQGPAWVLIVLVTCLNKEQRRRFLLEERLFPVQGPCCFSETGDGEVLC